MIEYHVCLVCLFFWTGVAVVANWPVISYSDVCAQHHDPRPTILRAPAPVKKKQKKKRRMSYNYSHLILLTAVFSTI